LSPPPIAVHDDRDMLRKAGDIDQGHGVRVSCTPDGSKNGSMNRCDGQSIIQEGLER
jgi:hypothetical protein